MNELKVEYIDIDKLKPYAKNARKHQQADVNTIKNSILEFGMCDPIGVWGGDNTIVEGHGRLIALKQLGYKKVPCIRLDFLTDEQRRAYGLAHNKTAEMSEWDFEFLDEELNSILDIDMTAFGFEPSEEEEPEAIEDDYEVEIPKEPKSKLGQIYKLGRHRLMCGDSTKKEDVKRLMGGCRADMLLTDPPYNVNYEGSTGMKIKNDNMADADFQRFLEEAFDAANENMREGAAFYIWHADSEGYNFREACCTAGWTIRQCLIWNKNALVMGRQDYQWKHEPCLYGWKDGAGHYFIDSRKETTVIEDQKPNIKKMKKEEMAKLLEEIFSDKVSTTIINEDKPLVNDMHPTMKPIKLMARLIKNSSQKEETVLDIFGGSGSTLIACEQLDRTCCMMEYDPKYVDVIIDRWEQFTGEKAVLIDEEE